MTGKHLDTHPFATQLDACRSPEAVSSVLRTQVQAFKKFREGDEKLMTWLNPIVNILFVFSATLGNGIGLVSRLQFVYFNCCLRSGSQPFSPANTIFTGIGVLLGVGLFYDPLSRIRVRPNFQVVRDIVASHDTLTHLFERINFFLQRLNIYTEIPLTNDLTKLLGKIMAELLSILAISTKEMSDRKMSELIRPRYTFLADYGLEKFLKRLVGRTDVEDGFQRLDTLTKEETLMAVTRNLEVTHHIDDNVMAVKGIVHDIDGDIKETKEVICDVDGNIKEAKEVIHGIDGNVKETNALTENIDDNVKVVADNVKVIQGVACSVDHNVKATKDGTHRFLSVSIHNTHYEPSQRSYKNRNRPTKTFVPP